MRSCFRRSSRALLRARTGFTLLETLATLLILGLILAALLQFMTSVDRSWNSGATDPFAEAAEAFETIAQNLSVATLQPYQDYADSTGAFRTDPAAAFTPYQLARRSDLDFVCGPSAGTQGLLASTGRTTAAMSVFFAAPCGQTQTMAQAGMNHLFNALGYFVEFGGDDDAPGFFAGPSRSRWRLKQVVQPTESLQVFATSSSPAWIQQLAGTTATTAILAENVVALVVLPERNSSDATLAPDYRYDSRDAGNPLTPEQLPPCLRVVLAAIDEASALRLAAAAGTAPPALIPPGSFQDAARIDPDIAGLDAALTTAKIGHRIFQRDIQVATASWSNAAAPALPAAP
jgi:uncharacterized protein (TIGR02599 family)